MSRRAGWLPGALCALGLLACGVPVGASLASGAAARPFPRGADGDWTRFDYDAARNGVGPARTGIAAPDLPRLRARVVALDGTADSSPVQIHAVRAGGRLRDVVVVTTAYGRTIAVDPATGRRLWEFVPRGIQGWEGSPRITTTTPIVGPGRRYLYAASPDGLIHKLRVSSGREVRAGKWPVRVTFDPTREKLASALNIDGRSLIAVTDGYIGDAPVYQGHVVAIDLVAGHITHVWNSLCSQFAHLIDPPSRCGHSDSAIWGRAGAVVEPGSGRLLVSTGNGDFDGRRNWGDSTLELSPALRLLHNWTPSDQEALRASDTDLGSSSPVLLPPFAGRRLAVQGGKSGRLALLDLDRLDGTRGPAGPRTGGELGYVPTPGGAELFSAPAVWRAYGRVYLFVADGAGTAAYVLTDPARPRLALAWASRAAGTSPVLAGGLLYVYDELGGAVNVYAPLRGRRLASLPAGTGHWNSPIVIGGRVILPTGNANDHATTGSLLIYHLPGR